MSLTRHHTDWLNLLEVSGPFLSVSVLTDAFPQELEAHDPHAYAQLKLAYDEWLTSRKEPEVHHAWIDFVLSETLELGDVLQRGQDIPSALEAKVDLHGETLRPDAIVARANGKVAKPELLICQYPSQQKLGGSLAGKRWSASPATRMMELLHRTDNCLGLVTNGEEWMIVHAKSGEVTGFGSWYAELLTEERIALRSFRSLLGLHRFFGVPESETFQGLLERSREEQKEVTDQLGRQVRRAVETLISSLDWVDRDQNRQLLADYDEKKLYEAALTVMMRLVFLLCAEERGLLLLGKNDLYDQHYAVNPLRDQLREEADQYGEEILESRYDAWSRLLSTFRAVHAGVSHEELHLPAYGGSLFDPDRFPFLEGRDADTNWKEEPASPLPINNRTVLELLESLQLLEVRVGKSRTREAQRLSFRALDIEQIGHVYEGLLDHTAVRADSPVLGLQGAKDLEPEVPLYALEDAKCKGENELISFLEVATERASTILRRDLGLYETIDAPKLPLACDNDPELIERVRPYIGLVRESSRGLPTVFTKGSVYVTLGSDRRSTGTHYTPRSLTEEIVQHTLEPLVYRGFADGVEPSFLSLKSAEEILKLKVCDLAMGSGAFLVQACRYLSERVVEAWERDKPDYKNLAEHREELLAQARRLVVEKCLYGVDKNPLAVEMAKLSLWLITLDAKKPFSFLDHALRCGDSLIGVIEPAQIQYFHPSPNLQSPPVIGDALLASLEEAEAIRLELEEFTVNDPRDGERKRRLLGRSEEITSSLKSVADLLVSLVLAGNGNLDSNTVPTVMPLVFQALEGRLEGITRRAEESLTVQTLDESRKVQPFHWSIEFPEVWSGGGFHAVIGNPPFLGGQRITGTLGTNYREYLIRQIANERRGSSDLCSYFLLRASTLCAPNGTIGYVTTNTISEGATREVGLAPLLEHNDFRITRAVSSRKWPGSASLEVTFLWLNKQAWQGKIFLDSVEVKGITSFLAEERKVVGEAQTLVENANQSFQGSNLVGKGFILDRSEVDELKRSCPKSLEVISPYLTGTDLTRTVSRAPHDFVVNFESMELEQAQSYPGAMGIVSTRVKPQRLKNRMKSRRERWWQFGAPAISLYENLRESGRYPFAISSISKYLWFARASTSWVFDHNVTVVVVENPDFYGLLNNSLHLSWAAKHSSTLESRPGYRPKYAFEKFPFPRICDSIEYVDASRALEAALNTGMTSLDLGLTEFFNLVHNPTKDSKLLEDFRERFCEMDKRILELYGWADISPEHDFIETSQGTRFAICEPSRLEILDRLLALNHQRYREEKGRGLHDGKKSKSSSTVKKSKSRRRDNQAGGQGELF